MKLRLTELALKAFDEGYQEYPKLAAGYDGVTGFWVEIVDPNRHVPYSGSGLSLADALTDLESRIRSNE